MTSGKIFFKETQRFRQLWLWILLLAITILPWLIVISDNDKIETALYGYPFWIYTLLLVVLMVFFYSIKMETRITEDNISIKFSWFHRKYKTYPREDLEKIELTTYNPILDYGGWGIRWGGMKTKAYTISGNKGLQLHLKNGHKILIGTQQPDEIRKILPKLENHDTSLT